MSAMTPTARSKPPNTSPRKSAKIAERAEERAPRRPGHVDAGRRPVVDDDRQARARRTDVVVVDAQPLGQPVEERQDERDHAEEQRHATEHQPEEDQEEPHPGEDGCERRAGHVDARRGPCAWRTPCRAGPAAPWPASGRSRPGRRRRGGRNETGRRSATSTPQSGMTSWAINSRMLVQSSFEHRSVMVRSRRPERSGSLVRASPATSTYAISAIAAPRKMSIVGPA